MNYLFIDTAEGTRVLLNVAGKYYYGENLKNAGSETLMPMIDGLLNDAGAKISDMDIFGACVGPGSFTGLRIGLTTIKTFCYSLDKPCFAVNNLRINSYNNNSEKVISIADAGNRVCYVAMFDGDKEVRAAECMRVDDVRKLIETHAEYSVSTDVKLGGVFQNAVAGVGKREMIVAAEKHLDKPISQKELEPLYIRKPQPERKAGDL